MPPNVSLRRRLRAIRFTSLRASQCPQLADTVRYQPNDRSISVLETAHLLRNSVEEIRRRQSADASLSWFESKSRGYGSNSRCLSRTPLFCIVCRAAFAKIPKTLYPRCCGKSVGACWPLDSPREFSTHSRDD